MNVLKVGGEFHMVCRDKNGKVKWKEHLKNGVVTQGLNNLLDVMFGAAAQTDPWLISLIDAAAFSALAPADTMASHAGWGENTDYDEGTRPAWVEAAAAGGVKASSSVAVFTMNASVTIKGAFLTSVNTKGGATGILFCTALFDEGDRVVVATDVIEVTYSLTSIDGTP